MAECPAFKRLQKDYLELKKDPLPYVDAEPLPNNILEWHYILRGPENTPYYGGLYHGKLTFSDQFPFRPPAIYMITPSGRFKTNTRLCMTMSDFHPDTWIASWTVGKILQGVLSFMLEETHTVGAIIGSTKEERQKLAQKSLDFNLKDKTVLELFPALCQEMRDAVTMRKLQKELAKFEGSRQGHRDVTESMKAT